MSDPTVETLSIDSALLESHYEAGTFDMSSLEIDVVFSDQSMVKVQGSETMLSAEDIAKLLVPGTHQLLITHQGQTTTLTLSVLSIADYRTFYQIYQEGVATQSITLAYEDWLQTGIDIQTVEMMENNQIKITYTDDTVQTIVNVLDVCMIRFQDEDDSGMETRWVLKGRKVSLFDPKRQNHQFLGWYLGQAEDAMLFDSDTLVQADTTLYAKWEMVVFATGITLKEPNKTEYLLEEAFKEDGLEVRLMKSDGSEEVLARSNYTVSAVSTDSTGNKEVIVSHGTFQMSFWIVVVIPQQPLKIGYILRETMNPEIESNLQIIANILSEELPNRSIEFIPITTTTDFAEAILAGEMDFGFLTSQQYAEVTLENPEQLDVFLSALQMGLQVLSLPKEEQMEAINAPGYTAEMATDQAFNHYRSMFVVRNATYESTGVDKINTLADLAGKRLCVQSVTSISYFHPAFLLHQNGLRLVTGTPNAGQGEVQAVFIMGHPSAITALMMQDCDAAVTYLDARSHSMLLDTYPNLFTDTKVIALSHEIHFNVLVGGVIDSEWKEAIQQAFIKLGEGVAGKEAIRRVFSHEGYVVANDSEYDIDREVYLFRQSLS